MKTIMFFIFLSLLSAQLTYAQWSENLKLFVSAGGSQPVESYVMNNFSVQSFLPDVFSQFSTFHSPDASYFADNWKTGVNLAAGFEYPVYKFFSAQFGFTYSHFAFSENDIKASLENEYENVNRLFGIRPRLVNFNVYRGAVNAYTLSLSGKVRIPLHIVSPYLVGGFGYMHIGHEPIEVSYTTDPLDIGISFSGRIPADQADVFMGSGGGGIVFNLSQGVKPFVEGTYYMGLTNNDNTLYYSIRSGFLFSLH
jgi:hypothetical protein